MGTETLLKSYRVDFLARFHGSDVARIELIHRGENRQAIKSIKDPENSEIFYLDLRNIDAAGVYRLLFTDAFGQSFERSYSFDPRYRQIVWSGEDRTSFYSEIPRQDGAGKAFIGPREDFSGKVDSYYQFGRTTGGGFGEPRENGFVAGDFDEF